MTFEKVRSINIDNETYFCIDDLYAVPQCNDVINNLDISEYVSVIESKLPSEPNISTRKIYFVINEFNSTCNEYIYVLFDGWTLIGSEKIDMSNKVNIIDIPFAGSYYKLVITSNESSKDYKIYVNKRGVIMAINKSIIE
jgi:hypothetical protein